MEYFRKLLEVFIICRAKAKEVTGLLHISDRLLAGELSRVSSARNSLTFAVLRVKVHTKSHLPSFKVFAFVEKKRKMI